ncbi:hypothetical protein OXYTRIMIC_453 [Oxytricha trifallax]|uniref:Uncharacterized protein n=1 Tax=Oxytricha trifallax TaxID=1172189 RepID=A0A073HZU1_9SPIT|nr:hypothetical protein OXYTRIMIC_453 [Oxytricha trifallax]
MEQGKLPTNGRRKLPVYTEKKDQGVSGNSQNQQTLEKYFESSKTSSQNSTFQNLNVQIYNRKFKDLDRFTVKLDNSRQLEFYQPVREAEGWVKRNERFAKNRGLRGENK